jgi:arylsulfatase A-like enzyme
MYEELKGMEEVLHQRKEELRTQLTTMENARENYHKDWTLLVANEKKLWKELQVAQGKAKLFILQTANDWESMATENKTKTTLYGEFIEQLPIKMGELLEEAKT